MSTTTETEPVVTADSSMGDICLLGLLREFKGKPVSEQDAVAGKLYDLVVDLDSETQALEFACNKCDVTVNSKVGRETITVYNQESCKEAHNRAWSRIQV